MVNWRLLVCVPHGIAERSRSTNPVPIRYPQQPDPQFVLGFIFPVMFRAEAALPRRSVTQVRPLEPLGLTRSKAARPSRESPEKDHTVSAGPPARNGRQAEDDTAPPRDVVPWGQTTHEPDDK
jgi:hypothetical protein